MSKQYNKADHQAAIVAQREAVVFLRDKGYSWKATGYALGKTGEFARSVHAKMVRKSKA